MPVPWYRGATNGPEVETPSLDNFLNRSDYSLECNSDDVQTMFSWSPFGTMFDNDATCNEIAMDPQATSANSDYSVINVGMLGDLA